jgi:nitrate reductase gamma subunit
MTAFVFGIIYASVLVFLVACAARAVRYARLPSHLRWELYPVPHEEAARAKHGGSYFEAADWWTKPAHFSFAGEMKVMLPEMLFLRALWESNRKLWYRSFLFHFGLYLLAGTIALALVAALGAIFTPVLIAGSLGTVLRILYTATGALGAAMAIVGAAGLLHRRLTDPDLKNYTTPGDIFNLLFFLIALGFLTAGYLLIDPTMPGVAAIARGLLTFDTAVQVPATLSAGLILGALLVAYIPLTHMSHFIAKYFTYHSIRWDDLPASRSAALRRKFAEYLTLRPTWAARHVGADGTRTWAQIATTNPTAGAKS